MGAVHDFTPARSVSTQLWADQVVEIGSLYAPALGPCDQCQNTRGEPWIGTLRFVGRLKWLVDVVVDLPVNVQYVECLGVALNVSDLAAPDHTSARACTASSRSRIRSRLWGCALPVCRPYSARV